jgi:hypothetical protein
MEVNFTGFLVCFILCISPKCHIGRSRRNAPTSIGGYSYWTLTQERPYFHWGLFILDAHAGTSLLSLGGKCGRYPFNRKGLNGSGNNLLHLRFANISCIIIRDKNQLFFKYYALIGILQAIFLINY